MRSFLCRRPSRISAAVVFLACGCSSSAPPGEQASVTGSVTYDGTAIEVDSTVLYSCEELGVEVGGKVDSMGRYSLRAGDPTVGIPPGRYKVMIHPPSPVIVMPDMSDPKYREMMLTGGGGQRSRLPESRIPDKFRSLRTSGIVVELLPGPNSVDFDLSALSAK